MVPGLHLNQTGWQKYKNLITIVSEKYLTI